MKAYLWKAILLLVLAALSVQTEAFGARRNYDVRLSFRRASLETVLDEFTKQTGVAFSYETSLGATVMESVEINTSGTPLEQVLNKLFSGTDISWKILDKVVALSRSVNAEETAAASGQEEKDRIVRGTIRDENGQPVAGVTVMEENTENATQSDLDGRWSLTLQNSGILVFSSIGYVTENVASGGRSIIDVTMREDVELLDEVVVIGYGTQKKVNITGSVTAIDFSKQMEGRPIMNTSASLAGMAPGMSVMQGSGQPGSDDATIRIRGVGSFTSSASAPLVLVDGIEWSMNNVNSNDIESISILKDAASTAIYGTRAAISYRSWNWGVSKLGATDWELNDISTYESLNSASSSAVTGWGLRSYFGRVNYSYKDRYLLEANLRVDGSSRFGTNNRYGVFPSFSAGWKIDQEPFMAGTRSWLDHLKLRASWGQTGNNMGIGNFAWQATYASGKVTIDGANSTGLYIASMSNINLKWETTATTDIGIDAGFFKNRLTAELDYYHKNTTDILFTPSSYLTMGSVSQVPSNLGSMWNQGIEVALNWRDQLGDNFHYWAGVNFSYNKNKVTSFKGKLEKYWANGKFYNNLTDVSENWSSPGKLCEGHAIGEHYLLQRYRGTGKGYSGGEVNINAGPVDGMIRTESDMAWVQAMIDSGYTFNGVKTLSPDQLWYGDFIFADSNGDGNYGNEDDKDFNGKSSTPAYLLGLNLGFSWKGFDFNMQWAGAFDYYIYWATNYYNSSNITWGYGISERVANDHYFYDPDNPSDSRTNINGTYPRLYKGSDRNRQTSDFYEYKGDYLKLKNVQVGYTLPQRITRNFFVQELRFYVSGENLLTITGYPGMDPEIGSSIGYPLMRQVSVGATVTF